MSEFGLGCLEPSISDTAAINTVCVASPIVANAKIPNTLGVKKWLTIKDQGRRNSCGGCAMDYAAETLRLMATKFRSRADNLSARWSYCAAIDWGQTWHRGDNGVSIEAVVMAARDYGTVLEEDCPYWADNEPFDRQLPDLRGKASQHRVESVARVTTGEEVIQGLGQGIGPTVFGMHWTQGMFSYSGGVIDRDPWGQNAGGHAVCACDYDQSRGLIYVVNSHGVKWGNQGWFEVTVDQMTRLLQQPFGAYIVSDLQGFKPHAYNFSDWMTT